MDGLYSWMEECTGLSALGADMGMALFPGALPRALLCQAFSLICEMATRENCVRLLSC